MIDGLPIAAVDGIGVVGLCVLVVIGFATGRIYTKRQYDDKASETSEWRTESRIKDQQILELTEQNRQMLKAFGPTLTDFLSGLRRAGVGTRESGEDS